MTGFTGAWQLVRPNPIAKEGGISDTMLNDFNRI